MKAKKHTKEKGPKSCSVTYKIIRYSAEIKPFQVEVAQFCPKRKQNIV